jgi:hypothetical protein
MYASHDSKECYTKTRAAWFEKRARVLNKSSTCKNGVAHCRRPITVAVISSGLFVLRLMLSRCVNLPTLDGKRYDGQHWRARKWLGVCNVGWLAWLENDSYSGRRCAVPYTLFMHVCTHQRYWWVVRYDHCTGHMSFRCCGQRCSRSHVSRPGTFVAEAHILNSKQRPRATNHQ